MSNKAMQATMEFFDSKGFKFKAVEERSLIETSMGGLDNRESMRVYILFDEDERSMGVRSPNFCKFQEDKKSQIYEVCSKMNDKYRWVKFYVDERDNTVSLSIDAIISLETCGPISLDLIMRVASIGDKAYPEFMKALWS